MERGSVVLYFIPLYLPTLMVFYVPTFCPFPYPTFVTCSHTQHSGHNSCIVVAFDAPDSVLPLPRCSASPVHIPTRKGEFCSAYCLLCQFDRKMNHSATPTATLTFLTMSVVALPALLDSILPTIIHFLFCEIIMASVGV